MNLIPLLQSLMHSLIETGATLVAAGTAIWGITAWRREHVGKRRIDLAEEVLTLAYQARDVVKAIRFLPEGSNEGSTREPMPDETATETRMLNYAFVEFERCTQSADLFAKLRSLRYRFMAQHGRASGKPFDQLDSIRSEFLRRFQDMAMEIDQLRRKRFSDEKSDDVYKAELGQLWDQWHERRWSEEYQDGKDLVLQRFDNAVSDLEKECCKVIGSQT